MVSEWKETTLGQVVNFRRGHDLPKSKMIHGEYPVIGSNGIIGYHNEKTTSAPCVSIGRSGNVGNPILIDQHCWSHNTTLYIDDFKGNDPKYVYYLLKTLNLKNFGGGSAVPTLNRNHIHPLEIKNPPLQEQESIAHILGSIDDKIELSRQINQTLEQMAQALFKSWFVDFDPVMDKALAAGNPIPDALKAKAEQRRLLSLSKQGDKRKALPKGIESLFPDAFEFNEELDKWVPEGWKANSIDELVRSVSDTYPLKSVEKVIFLNTGDIQEGKFLHKQHSEAIGLPGQAKKSIQKGDILYSEIRPKNRRYAYVYFDSDEYVVSTKLMVLRAITDINSLFVYYFLKQKENIDFMQLLAESRSGTFPQITFDILCSLKIALPRDNELVNYYTDNYLVPFYKKMIHVEKENQKTTKLRDTLLPKLISGEVRVKDIEQTLKTI